MYVNEKTSSNTFQSLVRLIRLTFDMHYYYTNIISEYAMQLPKGDMLSCDCTMIAVLIVKIIRSDTTIQKVVWQYIWHLPVGFKTGPAALKYLKLVYCLLKSGIMGMYSSSIWHRCSITYNKLFHLEQFCNDTTKLDLSGKCYVNVMWYGVSRT